MVCSDPEKWSSNTQRGRDPEFEKLIWDLLNWPYYLEEQLFIYFFSFILPQADFGIKIQQQTFGRFM